MRSFNILSNILLVLSMCSVADAVEEQAPRNGVIFVNGVRVDPGGLEESTAALRERVRLEIGVIGDEEFSRDYKVSYVHNTTRCFEGNAPGPDLGCLGDIYEAVLQYSATRGIQVDERTLWKWIFRRDTPSDVHDVIVSVLSRFDPMKITVTDTDKLVDKVRANFSKGTRTVLVPHSQGNFFANNAYGRLPVHEVPSVGVVAVATPASYVAGNGPYHTKFGDLIHLTPNALSPNTLNEDCTPLNCHDFVGSYLAGLSGVFIARDVLAFFDSLADPGEIGEPVIPDTLVVLDDYFDRLLIVDPATGATQFLMTMSRDFLSGLAYDRVSRLLYSVDRVTNELVAFDLKTRSERRVGVVGAPFMIDLAFGPQNKLFGMACGESSACRLVEIDTTTGVGTPRPSILFGQPFTLVYDPDSEKMYTTRDGLFGSLFELDPVTGTESFVNLGPKRIVYMADQPGSLDIFAIGRAPLNESERVNLVGTFDPRAPFFTAFARVGQSLAGIEMVSLEDIALPSNEPPVLRFPFDGGRFDATYPIIWIDEDSDSDASIDLFYSTNSSCANPTLIAGHISEDDELDTYIWDIASLPEDDYYLYATISDGVDSSSFCIRNAIAVDH